MSSVSSYPPPVESAPGEGAGGLDETTQRRYILIAAVVGVLLVAGLIAAVVFLIANPARTETIRDIFIILMAFESLVIGVALIVLIVQLARLTNLLQHEIRPILSSTNETVNTLRGTTVFLSENLVDPVLKLNSYLAAVMQVVNLVRPDRGRR